MQTILVVVHIFLAVGLIGLILIQHGKGADMGAAFGSGASGTVFGAKGSASFLTRLTAGLATLFFITSMVMAYFASQRDDGNVVLDVVGQPAIEQVEAQPQTDLPPMAGNPETSLPTGSDVPAPQPAADKTPDSEAGVPAAAVSESSEPAAAMDAVPATEPSDVDPAEPVQGKE